MTRSCGPCSACCTTTAVAAFSKPVDTPCQHLRHDVRRACGSCSIYQDRPRECAVYQCAWLSGSGPDEHRPDLCGVVAEVMFKDDAPFLAVLAVSPGFAPHNRVVRDVFKFWRDQGLAITFNGDVHATPAQRATLSNCIVQFADGARVRVGGQDHG